jgi:N-acyl-D-aspartate/D-glutamate deacylase
MARADLTIRDVVIHDGTGAEPTRGDVEVDGGRISSVGTSGPARLEIDGRGLVLCPGFVDVHTHDDGALLVLPDLRFKLAQGVTSVVVGNCGFSATPGAVGAGGGILDGVGEGFPSLGDYLDAVAVARPAVNAAAQIGHNSLRTAAVGDDRRAPTSAELARMRAWVTSAMEQGAVGLSSGLVYQPGRYAATEELVALAEAVGPHGGLYNTHLRNEGGRLLEAVDEALAIGRQAGVGVHISHHKAAGRRNWGRVVESLARVDAANAAGGDVTLDVYPYVAGSGPMAQYFDLAHVDLELAASIRLASCPAFPDYEGRHLPDLAAETGEELGALVTRILTAPLGRRTICIQFLMQEPDVVANLRHPRMMVGSDGIPDLDGRPHPRLYGTFPRVLGRYVRDEAVLALGEAIRRMTSLACDRFGLAGRGRVEVGAWADLVLFDPATVIDRATWDEPQQEPAGIALVVVNGEVALRDGAHTGARSGRPLRYRRSG